MIPLDEAQAHVIERCPPLPVLSVPLRDARGLVTAEGVTSPEQIPPFANTAVDGFAVIASDTAAAGTEDDGASVSLTVVDTIAAGVAPSVPVRPGQAIRIMTGAPLPDGLHAPTIDDGLQGIRFIAACIASSRANGAWTALG